jgi:hypothetical protein
VYTTPITTGPVHLEVDLGRTLRSQTTATTRTDYRPQTYQPHNWQQMSENNKNLLSPLAVLHHVQRNKPEIIVSNNLSLKTKQCNSFFRLTIFFETDFYII